MANIKITELSAVTTLADNDIFPCVAAVSSSAATSKITVENLRTVVGTGNTSIAASNYSSTPAVGNVIDFSSGGSGSTAGIEKGNIVSVVQSSNTLYFLVTNVVTDTSVTLAGPSLCTSGANPISVFTVYAAQRAVIVDLLFSGSYAIGGTTTELINRETSSKFRWNNAKGYFLYAIARQNTVDGSTQGQIMPTIARSSALSTYNDLLSTNITLAGTTAWTASSNTVDSAQYGINFGDEIEIDLKNAGGNGDARDLTVSLVFALEF